jgi:hypothetical protein
MTPLAADETMARLDGVNLYDLVGFTGGGHPVAGFICLLNDNVVNLLFT